MTAYRDVPREVLPFLPGVSKDYWDSYDCVACFDNEERWQMAAGVSPSENEQEVFMWLVFNPLYPRTDIWRIVRDSRKYIEYHKKSGRTLCCVVHQNRESDVRFARALGFVENTDLSKRYELPERFMILCLK